MENINKKLDALCDKMDTLQKSVDFLSHKYEELKNNAKAIIENQEVVNKTVNKVKKEQKEQRQSISELKDRVEYLERKSLETSINLYPVLQTQNENLQNLVMIIAGKIGLKIGKEGIQEVYRRKQKKNGKPGEVVIKFVSKDLKEEFLISMKKKRLMHMDLGITCAFGRIYANEELSQEAKNIYFGALRFKKENNWKFMWSKGGRVYLKKEEATGTIRLDSMDILQTIMGKVT